MSDAALEAAARVGLYDGERVDRTESTRRLIEILNDHPGDPLVDADVLTIEELTFRIYQSSEPDLRSLVAQLCSLSPHGPVQRTLNGNHQMLCGRRVVRIHEDNGIIDKQMKMGRFLSSDPGVVVEFLLEASAKRAVKTTQVLRELHDLAVQRIPALTDVVVQRRRLFLSEVQPYLLPPAAPPPPPAATVAPPPTRGARKPPARRRS
jgi:hypothetical protein